MINNWIIIGVYCLKINFFRYFDFLHAFCMVDTCIIFTRVKC